MAWFPPGVDPVEHAALVPGIPPWMQLAVFGWVQGGLENTGDWEARRTWIPRGFDVEARRVHPVEPAWHKDGARGVWLALDDDESRFAFIDYLLYVEDSISGSVVEPGELEDILRRGGSEWRVGSRNGHTGLEKRVPQGVADAAEAVIAASSTAGALLSEAWHAAFGRGPNPEEAYEKAIKAVEEAGANVVSPNNGRATLGTMIRDMENQGDWCLPLATGDSGVPLAAARALWQGQESRHGGNGYRTPTPEEAEAAVLLAVPLVQWFTSGVLQRRP